MEKLLNNLFVRGVKSDVEDEAYKETYNKFEKTAEKLLNLLNEEQAKVFDEYNEKLLKFLSVSDIRIIANAFELGADFTAKNIYSDEKTSIQKKLKEYLDNNDSSLIEALKIIYGTNK